MGFGTWHTGIVTPASVSAALDDRVLDLLLPLANLRYLVDTTGLRNSLQVRLRLLADCACGSATHLMRMHDPTVFAAAASTHDTLILHALAVALPPPVAATTHTPA